MFHLGLPKLAVARQRIYSSEVPPIACEPFVHWISTWGQFILDFSSLAIAYRSSQPSEIFFPLLVIASFTGFAVCIYWTLSPFWLSGLSIHVICVFLLQKPVHTSSSHWFIERHCEFHKLSVLVLWPRLQSSLDSQSLIPCRQPDSPSLSMVLEEWTAAANR